MHFGAVLNAQEAAEQGIHGPCAIIAAVRHRKVLAVACVAAIGLLPIVPPEHVHETYDSTGRAQFVEHRHAEPHEFATAPDDDHGSTVDHAETVVNLDPVFTAPEKAPIAAPAFTPVLLIAAPVLTTTALAQEIIQQPIHGPPRALSRLRAPPSSPAQS